MESVKVYLVTGEDEGFYIVNTEIKSSFNHARIEGPFKSLSYSEQMRHSNWPDPKYQTVYVENGGTLVV